MFEFVFLGTSASAPSVHRGLSAHMVKHNEHRFLVDCGEGTQRQILKSGLGFKRLHHILITHGHLDHILGLAGLFSTFTRWETLEDVEIQAGHWALERIDALLYGVRVIPKGKESPIKVSLRPIQPGVIFEAEDFHIRAFPVSHRGPDCYGFVFEERAHRPFLPDKAEALGVPAGSLRRELVNGKAVTLENGSVVKPEQVLGKSVPGVKLVHVGDTGSTADILEHARGADALVIEATYLEAERDMAAEFAHLTARQAAELAAEAQVGQLLLTHVSRRYRESDVLAEAQAIFPRVAVARDFDAYQIKQGEVKKVEDS
ncbi:MAG TPA: ribonuclease Z [Anaerolineales bacterium]|nr:ribonuclease Z [Anaerolineales bacterium]